MGLDQAMTSQALLTIEEQPAKEERKVNKTIDTIRIRKVSRDQTMMVVIDVEKLIPESHTARAIWELIGKLELSAFVENKSAMFGLPGRPNTSPQLLISLWLYGYCCGTNSAREIAGLCGYHPAFQWLTGMQKVNYKSLSDFRTQHSGALDKLFVQVLAVMDQEDLIDLELVAQDGTKVRAWASSDTFRREKTLQKRLEQAEELLKETKKEDFGKDQKVAAIAAQKRAAAERVEKVTAALGELEKVRANLAKSDQEEARVSYTDPEARIIKGANGGYQPSYNVQLVTDAKHTVIVAVDAIQSASDASGLKLGMKQVNHNLGRDPKKVVVDAGYATYANARDMEQQKIDLYASIPNTEKRNQILRENQAVVTYGSNRFEFQAANQCAICPAGKTLQCVGVATGAGGQRFEKYQAEMADCKGCEQRVACCGNKQSKLIEINAGYHAMARLKEKMATEEGQTVYRKRGQVAEFPNAWLKTKFNFRQTYLRGLAKVKQDAKWHALAYNAAQWARLCWRPQFAK